ncbi:MAG TPA: methionine adenosyltransferase, partial [Thermoprotei archaeon]|nr:methionine adenosyltransferase [Thermoprotei archaeon]
LAKIVANKIYEETGVCEVYVEILSQIGKPINKPLIANISIIPSNNSSFNSVKYEAENIMQEWLDNIHRITEMILNREISIF